MSATSSPTKPAAPANAVHYRDVAGFDHGPVDRQWLEAEAEACGMRLVTVKPGFCQVEPSTL